MQICISAPALPLHVASGTSFGTFTTWQDVSPSPPVTIPASSLNVGLDIELYAQGSFSTTGTPTISIGFWFNAPGTTILAQSSVITTGSGAAAWPWIMRWNGRLRSATQIQGSGWMSLGSSLIAFNNEVPIPITAALRTVAVDTTAARSIGVGCAYGTSSASNTIQTDYFRCLLSS